ncbi:hypothetical protein TWF694_000894 [Orbilia ellipsospora]|uniref:C2H2-type domain-containing protein n=1 Tax=Orbilia ellipsospora TaxID=2528407 RepID=A0AAV9XWM2_9PEZI
MSKRLFDEMSPPSKTCNRCKQEFFTVDHAQEHFGKYCQDLWCDICKESFKDVEETREHMRIHKERPRNCPRCGFKPGVGKDLLTHWKETNCHVQCQTCKEWFFYESFTPHFELSPYCRRAHLHREESASSSVNQLFVSGWEIAPLGSEAEMRPFASTSANKSFISGSENRPFASIFDPRGEQGFRTRELVAGTALKSRVRAERDPYMINEPSKNLKKLDDVVYHDIDQLVRKEKCIKGFGGATKYLPEPKAQKLHVDCFGCCGRTFPSMYAMIAHLESGDCPSKITRGDVNYTFAIHPRSEQLMPKDSRKTLSALLSYGESEKPFQCSIANCNAAYKRLSAMICHAEDGHCRLKFESGFGSILDNMRKCVFRQSVIRKIEVLGVSARFGIYICPPPSKIYQCFEKDSGLLRRQLSDLTSHVLRLGQHPSLSELGLGHKTQSHDHNGYEGLFYLDPVRAQRLLVGISDAVSRVRKELKKFDNFNLNQPLGDIAISFEQTGKMRPLGRFLDDVQMIRSLIGKDNSKLDRVSEPEAHVF